MGAVAILGETDSHCQRANPTASAAGKERLARKVLHFKVENLMHNTKY